MAITGMSITLAGRAESGTVAIESGSTRIDIASDSDRSFSITISVPDGAKSFGLTTIAEDGRRLTRRFQVRRLAGVLGGAS